MHTSPSQPLDVRQIPPPVRHATIFSILQDLAPGTSLFIVNDHDPVPLHRQIDARYPDAYSWTYLLQGPDLWQVEIGRLDAAAEHAAGCDSDGGCTCG